MARLWSTSYIRSWMASWQHTSPSRLLPQRATILLLHPCGRNMHPWSTVRHSYIMHAGYSCCVRICWLQAHPTNHMFYACNHNMQAHECCRSGSNGIPLFGHQHLKVQPLLRRQLIGWKLLDTASRLTKTTQSCKITSRQLPFQSTTITTPTRARKAAGKAATTIAA